MTRCSVSVIAEDRGQDWVVALGSESYAERKAAHDRLEGYREEVFTGLMSLLERPVVPGEPFFDLNTTRNMAIHLLGVYRFEEATPALIERLSIKPIQDGTQDNPLIPPPAAVALKRIGAPAVPLLLQKLKSTTDVLMADQCVKVIYDIEGTADAGKRIREAIRHEEIPTQERVMRLLDALEGTASSPNSKTEGDTDRRDDALARLDRFSDDWRAALASPSGWWSALREVVHEMGFACLRAGLSKADIVSRLGTGNQSYRRDDQIGISYYPSAMLVFKFDERGTLVDAIDGGRSLRVTMLVRDALERATEREAYRRTVTDQAAILAGCANLRVLEENVETGGDFLGRSVLDAVYKGRPFEVTLEWYGSMLAAFAHVDELLEFSPTDSEGVEYVVGPNGADGLGDVEIRSRIGASRSLAFIRNNVWVMIPTAAFDSLLDELAGELDRAISGLSTAL